jgi:hypothetical protein
MSPVIASYIASGVPGRINSWSMAKQLNFRSEKKDLLIGN